MLFYHFIVFKLYNLDLLLIWNIIKQMSEQLNLKPKPSKKLGEEELRYLLIDTNFYTSTDLLQNHRTLIKCLNNTKERQEQYRNSEGSNLIYQIDNKTFFHFPFTFQKNHPMFIRTSDEQGKGEIAEIAVLNKETQTWMVYYLYEQNESFCGKVEFELTALQKKNGKNENKIQTAKLQPVFELNIFMHSTQVPIPYSEWYSLSYKEPQTAEDRAKQNKDNAATKRDQNFQIDQSHTIRYYMEDPKSDDKYFAFQIKKPKEPIHLIYNLQQRKMCLQPTKEVLNSLTEYLKNTKNRKHNSGNIEIEIKRPELKLSNNITDSESGSSNINKEEQGSQNSENIPDGKGKIKVNRKNLKTHNIKGKIKQTMIKNENNEIDKNSNKVTSGFKNNQKNIGKKKESNNKINIEDKSQKKITQNGEGKQKKKKKKKKRKKEKKKKKKKKR